MLSFVIRLSVVLTAAFFLFSLFDLAQRAFTQPFFWIIFALGLFLFPFYIYIAWKGIDVILKKGK